jgi:transposase
MYEAALQTKLFPVRSAIKSAPPDPDWAIIHQELARKHVTRECLWQEYKAQHPGGYRYGAFCERYRAWAGKLAVSMRQTHRPGEKLFVDYAGTTLAVVDPSTGEIRQAQLFVAVLGALIWSPKNGHHKVYYFLTLWRLYEEVNTRPAVHR